ncbi:hypothetical protein H0W26_02360 [Candidatus Dependentiae bacterium]|nr:hypothetical protein [Candidatus Dependentiae bacterium]
MKNILMYISEKMLLRKRGMIESVGAILKSSCNIDPSDPYCIILSWKAAYTLVKQLTQKPF